MKLNKGKELQNGKYRIIDVLGQGGFGITYLALQVKLNRKVAIKEFFMKEHCNRDENSSFVSVPSVGSRELVERFKQKFLKEAGLIASFDNANIIRIHDVFEENGTAYYVMEYLEGKSLKALVDESGALPEDVAVKYIRQVAGALKEVHENNLLHLDVKPANIMLDKKGNAVLIDFGISKHYDEAGHQTSSAGVGISEGYAPIEQYEAGALKTFTPVTDIYALGATLFFLLTGARPPKASYINDEGLPPMPETLSLTVRKAVESAMQPRRKDRPQSVKEFLRLVESGEMKDESGKMKDATSIFGNASSDGSSAASQNVMPLGSQKASVAKDESGEMKDERAKSKDETNLSMGTGQNAANGNAAVEEDEIEVEVVEVPSAAQKPASEPKQPKEKKSSKGLWIVILLLLVIGGAAGGFMFFGGGGDVKRDSVKDSSVQLQQTVDFSSGSKNLSFNPSEKDITPSEAFSKGKAADNKKDYSEAVKWYRKAAEQGNAQAQNNLGVCYENGEGVTQSYSEAVKWFRKAAEQGQVNAQHNLGWCYENGYGVSKSYYEAVKWYRKAAEQGNAYAQCNLGFCYEKGYGVSQSWSEAVKWYRKGAEQGDAQAQHNLGLCYEYGKGVSQSYYEAVKWYRKAAEQGQVNAQYNLGDCYEYGKGVSKSISDAVKWYRKAAEQGHQKSKDALKRLGY